MNNGLMDSWSLGQGQVPSMFFFLTKSSTFSLLIHTTFTLGLELKNELICYILTPGSNFVWLPS